MHQFLAVFYELRHETSIKNVAKTLILVTVLMIIVLGSTTKLFFSSYSSTLSGVFTLSIALFWVGIFNSITSICRIRPRIKVQVVQGLSISSYVLANTVYQLIRCLIQALVVVLLFFVATKLDVITNCPSEGVFFPLFVELFIFAFLVIFSSDTLGLVISSICPNEITAMTTMPFILIAEMVLSNALFPLPDVCGVSLGWASLFMVSRWGIDLLGTICNVTSFPTLPGNIIPNELPEILCQSTTSHLFACVCALIGISIFNIFVSTILLRHIKREILL